MKWESFVLTGKRPIGKDELNNITFEEFEIGAFEGRLTPWTADDVNVLGREFTTANRQAVIVASPDVLKDKQVSAIAINSKQYRITGIVDLDRYVLVHIKGYRI